MQKILVMTLGMILLVASAQAAVDWAQPPVSCVEEIVPSKPDRTCLDLTVVADPTKDFPADLSPDELAYWQINKRPLLYCRANEVLRRERAQPGSQTPARIENAWMQTIAVEHRAEKIRAVYAASRASRVPAQVLSGALTQESLFSELGIAEDGANYSCGIGQINLVEWCHWAETRDAKTKAALGWPASGVSCAALSPGLIAPFYKIAKTRLDGLPEYRLASKHFENISLRDVVEGFPAGSASEDALRFQTATSFIRNCSEVANGIAAKANELALLYSRYVPAGLRALEHYASGDSFQRRCQEDGYKGSYPLHTGWLLAVGIYNAGPRATDVIAYYNRWDAGDLAQPKTFRDVRAPDLIEGVYWGGKFSESDEKLHFTTVGGANTSWGWFKPCVLQRHIARVVQHATVVGHAPLVESLEGAYKCSLAPGSVPLERQRSSGRRQ